MARYPCGREAILATVLVLQAFLGPILSASAVPIANDPNGFETIPWGSILREMDAFTKIDEAGRLQRYELSRQTPVLGAIPVDSLRFTTFENKLGRVTVRYTGQASHAKILDYLESTYGPLDRTPGQIAAGPIRVYTWQGTYTEVTLRFESGPQRGIIFFESRTLPEKLKDETATTAF
ncbi:MAG: hypothetical protein OEV01_10810 [Nitrospira sp.]|nr:hypothetical protein [Nitrospira sp.]MDH4303548.1 hypothetical protein [Nitrospira sp.]MDH5195052.1 hypothetical protein [Nitrospira sp.]